MRSRSFFGAGTAAVALGTVALACAFLPITSGCQGHQCDYSEADFGLLPGQGALVANDPNTWETNPIDGEWVPYPHAHRTKLFAPFNPQEREIVNVQIYISPDQHPGNTPNTNWSSGAGNLASIRDFGAQIWVDNGTCADFFMRAVITASPIRPDAGDAGRDAANDAPTDADEGGN